MIDKKLILLLLISLISSAPVVLARAEYNSLPQLDGKVDNSTSSMREELENQKESSEPVKPAIYTDVKPSNEVVTQDDIDNLPQMDVQKVASSNPVTPKKDAIVAIDSPKLDKLTPDISKSNLTDTIRFANYEKDLNKVLDELADLSATIENGTQIQLFSAKATSVMFLNDIFMSKYEKTQESQLESYKLVQEIVKSAIFIRDYWIDSNKIKYNQKGIPDQIIKTKFLKISTNVDKLLEIVNINKVLTEE